MFRCECSLAFALLALACDQSPKPAPSAPSGTAPLASASASALPPLRSARSIEREEAPSARDFVEASPGEAIEIGPAGPATASAAGVVMITKSDKILLAKLGAKKASITRVKAGADMLRPHARGPAIAGDFAYWVSSGRLVREKLEGGTLEVLANDARDGVRVAAATVASGESTRAVAAYVADRGASTVARLWVEGVDTWTITPQGSAATSVALVAHEKSVVALSIEARTGMTPVHARVADFASSPPKLDEDVVVWVTGPAQSLVEIAGIAEPDGSLSAFVPLERDISRFGLAHVKIGKKPTMGAPVLWRAYDNGLDPAPLATATTCGSASVVYTTPEDAKPHAPQELALSRIAGGTLGPPQLVARAKAVINVSLADTPHGALVSYVADGRSWATVVPCAAKKR